MKCPTCQSINLVEKKYESVALDECPQCLGVWLDEGEISQILSEREAIFSKEEIQSVFAKRRSGINEKDISTKQCCPKCNTQMKVLNYGYDSGIIIDRCPLNHGLWLDNKEIEALQITKEEWEKIASKENEKWAQLLRKSASNQPIKKETNHSLFTFLVKLFHE